jgi:hypothetical protein
MTSDLADTVSDRLRRIHPDADVQAALAVEGLDSAVAISQHSRAEFLGRVSPRLLRDDHRARQAYAQATRCLVIRKGPPATGTQVSAAEGRPPRTRGRTPVGVPPGSRDRGSSGGPGAARCR